MKEIIKLKNNLATVEIHQDENNCYYLIRKNDRNKIINKIDHIQYFDLNNHCSLIKIDDNILYYRVKNDKNRDIDILYFNFLLQKIYNI